MLLCPECCGLRQKSFLRGRVIVLALVAKRGSLKLLLEAATGVWRLLVAQDKRGGSEVSHAQKSGISRLEASEAKVRLSEQFGNSDLHRTNREKQFGNSDLHRVTEEVWPSASSASDLCREFC